MKPCTGGPTGAWWARDPCCNIMSELGLSPWQLPWPGTLTAVAEILQKHLRPTQGVRAPLQAAFHPLLSVSVLQPHSNPAYSWNWHLKVSAQSAALTGSLYTTLPCHSWLHPWTQDPRLGSHLFGREGGLDTADWPQTHKTPGEASFIPVSLD